MNHVGGDGVVVVARFKYVASCSLYTLKSEFPIELAWFSKRTIELEAR